MLSPNQLETAGDAVAAIYSNMEAEMLDHMVRALLNVENLPQKTMTELNLLAQSQSAALRQIADDHRGAISDEVWDTCERLLSASDRDDSKRLGTDEITFPQQMAATVAGMQLVLDRDNLDMQEGAKRAFLSASIEAVTKTNSGLYTDEEAIHSAVRKLERDGIPIISYRNAKTGVQTVQNKVDVAVRRHVRTQIAQDSGRMTMDRLEEMDIALVEVSSHEGARPSHQAWEGRVYSLHGDIVIDGVRYRDFYSATGYGQVDGLLGANCRHSFGPYRHGAPRAYHPDPKSETGLSNDEIYELTQKQRYIERQIREAKREVRGATEEYKRNPDSLTNKTNLLKAQKSLKERQASMRDFIKDSNAKCKPGTSVLYRNTRREWAGDMPNGVKVNASQRSLNEFIKSRSSQIKASGLTQKQFKAEISGLLSRMNATSKDFSSLSRQSQHEIADAVLKRRTLLPVEERRKNLKPASQAFVTARTREIERVGGTVWMDDEATRYLNSRNADAATLGDIVALRRDATISEVLEEEFHLHQHLRGDYAECQVGEMVIRREIDAQQYLLDVARQYKIPRVETDQTLMALQRYQNELKELLGEDHR